VTGQGQRGGTTVSFEEAGALFQMWRAETWGWLKARIVVIARRRGEFHGDDLAGVELGERNIIGAVVNALVTSGWLESTGEHRAGRSAASHGRRSYVYRLTERGEQLADSVAHVERGRLPQRPERVAPEALFSSPAPTGDALTGKEPERSVVRHRLREQPVPVPLTDEFWEQIELANELRREDAALTRPTTTTTRRSDGAVGQCARADADPQGSRDRADHLQGTGRCGRSRRRSSERSCGSGRRAPRRRRGSCFR
jgi:uncharacterized low-complexity protein